MLSEDRRFSVQPQMLSYQVISQGQNGLQAQYVAAACRTVMASPWQALARFQNASDARAAATSSATGNRPSRPSVTAGAAPVHSGPNGP